MKKFLKLVLAFLIIFFVVGCGNDSNETGENNDQKENQEEAKTGNEVDFPTNDVTGDDPLIVPRYPGSIRTRYQDGMFVSYFAEAEIEEVVQFYRDFADEINFEFVYEVLPGEEQEHWLHITDPDDSLYRYGITLDLYLEQEGYADWILYAPEWPE